LRVSLPVPLAYDPTITAASLVIAVVTSGIALWVVAHLARGEDEGPDWPILVAGAVIMGAGISGMHYTGMAAMRMTPPIQYTPWLFALSIGVAITVSVVALWLAFTLRSGNTQAMQHHRVLAAVVMGLAIAGMHYTGMAAAVFQPGALCGASGVFALDGTTLGYLLGGASLMLLLAAISAPRPVPPAGYAASRVTPARSSSSASPSSR
jgi:diguanylate cyclase